MAVPSRRATNCVGLLACSVMLAGCTNTSSTATPYQPGRYQQPARFDDIYRNRSPEVVRYDRYTLVSTRPADAQRDPLNQIVDITMPAQLVNTVGEGYRYLLLESGYSLCSATSSAFSELLNRPLPAVQRAIGPVKLSEALQIVAGPAWRLRVDEVNREVCFELRDQYRSFAASAVMASAPVKQGSVSLRPHPSSVSQPVPTSVPVAQTTARNPFTAEVAPTVSTPTQQKTALMPQSLPVPSPVIYASKPTPLTPNKTISSTNSAADTVKTPGTKPTAVNAAAGSDIARPATPVTTVAADNRITPTGTAVTALSVGQSWRAEPGSTLKETLNSWASKASCAHGGSWVVVWPVALDYRIDAPLVFHGNFESVLVQVFGLYRQAEKPLFAEANRIQCLLSVSDTPAGGGR
ncbi:TcpQ domain-containing protein [Erwinia amylovora]|uniref:PFGI-1 class ICE element type IV pilus protein PilL2 n=1 Tax=Erwinia amylovora TaxID=552 RepID=UPI001D06F90E|nr:TcpQ domain-containing protein [Erwinia amylovora]UDJ86356.1 TcpQ domain-containing protein [Erwinia amylovora]UDJ97815.1 TcpQ domain-containing protein [Erwinia amylovora]UDK90125.1 TcpQ domain-containing protein [Erwinia amylovora]UDK93517.1 TcpQ domain-containing protein [Erwinia amylovora]UOD74351.1 TcpQ domain-containing protein [Erwinia amylovora]